MRGRKHPGETPETIRKILPLKDIARKREEPISIA
jgi:hypothetical protein